MYRFWISELVSYMHVSVLDIRASELHACIQFWISELVNYMRVSVLDIIPNAHSN